MKPLTGQRAVVTRAAHQAEELAHPLREHGAEVILLPVIGIARPSDPEPLRAAVRSDKYDWIILTSANAVAAFREELTRAGRTCKARVAAIGSATRNAAQASGLHVDLVPDRYVSESLVDSLGDMDGAHILIPSAAVTRDVVTRALRDRGAHVDVVEAYRNILPPEAAEHARTVFQRPYPDWVTFASPSAVTNLVRLIGTDILMESKLASIGPITSEKVCEFGLSVAAEARVYAIDGLVEAIIQCTRPIH